MKHLPLLIVIALAGAAAGCTGSGDAPPPPGDKPVTEAPPQAPVSPDGTDPR